MDGGCIFAFEDDAFGEVKEKTLAKLESYNAKVCQPEWFLTEEALESVQGVDRMMVHKYRAEHLFVQRKYQNALTEFENCESMVPPNNSPVGRDVSEAICRCLVHLGSFEAARERVEKLKASSQNASHRIAALHLELSFLRHSGDDVASVSTLQRLLSLIPCNADLWFRLHEALSRQNPSLAFSTGSVQGNDTDSVEWNFTGSVGGNDLSWDDGPFRRHDLLTSLAWAKVSLSEMAPTTAGFVLEADNQLSLEIAQKLKTFEGDGISDVEETLRKVELAFSQQENCVGLQLGVAEEKCGKEFYKQYFLL